MPNVPITHWRTRLILTLDQTICAQFPTCIVPIGICRRYGEVGILGRTVGQNCQQTRQQSSHTSHLARKNMGPAQRFRDMAYLYHKDAWLRRALPILLRGKMRVIKAGVVIMWRKSSRLDAESSFPCCNLRDHPCKWLRPHRHRPRPYTRCTMFISDFKQGRTQSNLAAVVRKPPSRKV